jgi:hypothetical protein
MMGRSWGHGGVTWRYRDVQLGGVGRWHRLKPVPRGADDWQLDLFGCVFVAAAEDGCAYADLGGTFFDGDFEIIGHAHGKDGEVAADSGGEAVAQIAQGAEIWTRRFGILGPGRDGHQAFEVEMAESHEGDGKRVERFGLDAAFGRFLGEANFDEDRNPAALLGGGLLEFASEGEAVDGIDAIEDGGGVAIMWKVALFR